MHFISYKSALLKKLQMLVNSQVVERVAWGGCAVFFLQGDF